VGGFLKILFWLSDKHYEKIRVSIDKYHIGRDNQPIKEDEKNTEPFFKYFYISKNTIFALLLLTFILAIFSFVFPVCIKNLWPFGEFSLSNPFVILFFFLILFSCEKLSTWLNLKIKEFFEKESAFHKKVNFIERLHNYQYQNNFKLKLK
jgi:ABC-type bacteriocin/lantibiotic exporter with double-glycine peptidase domain